MPKSAVPLTESGYMPKSATPIQDTSPPVSGNAITNFLPSLGRNVGDMVSGAVNVVNPDPSQNTLVNLASLYQGTRQKAEEIPVVGQGVKFLNKTDPGYNLLKNIVPDGARKAEAVGDFYKDRYGGIENVKNTFNQDPVGVLLDLSTALGGVGLLGKTATVGKVGKISQAANIASKASQITDPIQVILKGISKATKTLGDSKVGQTIQAPFKDAYNPEVVALAKEQGIDLPISAMTNNRAVKGIEALLERGVFGGKITKQISNAKLKLEELADNLTTQFVSPSNVRNVGQIIQKGFNEFQDNFNKVKSDLYSQVPEEVNKATATFNNTKASLQEIIDNKSKSLATGTNIQFYKDLLNKIESGSESVDNLVSKILDSKGNPIITKVNTPATLTVDNLRKTRTIVGEKLKNFADPIATGDKASLGKLYASLSQDIDSTIKALDPKFGEALDQANTFYKENITKINSKFGKKIANSDPEKLVDDLIKPNSETAVTDIKSVIGEEGTIQLQDAFMQKLLKNSIKGNVLDSQMIINQINKYGDSTIKALLTEEQYTKLQNVVTEIKKIESTRDALKKGTRPAEGSQTAFLTRLGIPGLGALIDPILTMEYLLSEFGFQKFVTSNFGKKFLTTGIDIANPVGNALEKVSPGLGNLLKGIRIMENNNNISP